MAVGLDDIQTELADLDIEVNTWCLYQIAVLIHLWDPIVCVKVTDEAVLSQLAQLCQRYGIDAEKISCEYFSFATNTKTTIMGKLLRGEL